MAGSARIATCAAVLTALSTTASAGAATPSEGTVSAQAPTTTWTGTNTVGVIALGLFLQDPTMPCSAPACDAFSLDVQDAGRLTLSVEMVKPAQTGLRINAPDGTQTFQEGDSEPGKPYAFVIKSAAAGTYGVDITNAHYEANDYSATATLATAAVPTVEPPPVVAAPAPATLSVKRGKASARKLARTRRYVATVTSSAPLTSVRVVLTRGSKVLGRGRLQSLDGTAKVRLKLRRKLGKGRYRLAATGVDAAGRAIAGSARLKITR